MEFRDKIYQPFLAGDIDIRIVSKAEKNTTTTMWSVIAVKHQIYVKILITDYMILFSCNAWQRDTAFHIQLRINFYCDVIIHWTSRRGKEAFSENYKNLMHSSHSENLIKFCLSQSLKFNMRRKIFVVIMTHRWLIQKIGLHSPNSQIVALISELIRSQGKTFICQFFNSITSSIHISIWFLINRSVTLEVSLVSVFVVVVWVTDRQVT